MYKRNCPHCNKEVSYDKLKSLLLCDHCFKSFSIEKSENNEVITSAREDKPNADKVIPVLSNDRVKPERVNFKKASEIREDKPTKENLLEPLSAKEQKKTTFKKLSWLVFVLILAGIIALVGKFWGKIIGNEEQAQHHVEEKVEARKELPALYLRLADHQASQEVLESFLSAQSVEEAEPYVLPDPKLSSTLKKYWIPRSFKQVEPVIRLSRVLDNKVGVIHFFKCQNADGRTFFYPVYSFNGNDNSYVGWRVAEQIEDVTVQDIVNQRLAGSYKIRCLLVQEDYYNYGYDPEDWISLGCFNSNSSLENYVSLRCYLNRKGEIYDKIYKAMKNESGREMHEMANVQKDLGDQNHLLAPQNLYELGKKKELTATRPYTHCVVDIKVVDKDRGVAEIVGFVCETLEEYFSLYQEPHLKSLGIIKEQ